MIGWDGHKMSKSRGNLVLVSRLRADGVEPAAIRLACSPVTIGRPVLERPGTRRGKHPAAAVADRDGAAPPHPTRQTSWPGCASYLADDLDTPKAIAALDGWTTDALDYGGHDTEAARTWPPPPTRCSASSCRTARPARRRVAAGYVCGYEFLSTGKLR